MSTNFSHLGLGNPLAYHMDYLMRVFCLCGSLNTTDDFTLSLDGGEIFIMHGRCGKRLHETTVSTIDLKPVPVNLEFTMADEVAITVATLGESNDSALAG